jgi:hypothetical protein
VLGFFVAFFIEEIISPTSFGLSIIVEPYFPLNAFGTEQPAFRSYPAKFFGNFFSTIQIESHTTAEYIYKSFNGFD